ncbi:MAG: Response regulator of zinc sigma-54-dependent two-component system [Labilithrix sp.]|nr:Response regulator of zinc sigma-54-dependent two-component system [Labilithrix sp.]
MPRSEDFGEPELTRAKHANPLAVPGAAAAVELVRLHVVVERVAGRETSETHVFDGDVCRIGSHASNDLVLDDKTISRFHCRIAREGNAWRITDTGSKNGTRLGGVKVLAAELENESVLVLGESSIRVKPVSRGHVSRIAAPSQFGAIVGQSAAMQRMFAVLERVAASEIDVLIHGESGTGKELVATELVQRSGRADGPVVVVDCSSISPNLVESELFGHVRGAFTGADREREGAFEAADGGTLFLDEIGELPLELQPKLLRALEAREVRRVGQTKMKRIDVRVIAATNRDLEREVNRGRFREDLYYRLAKVSVRVPPLRDRIDDIPLLVRSFLDSARSVPGAADAHASKLFSPAVLEEMQLHDWPGNVRELKNYIERSVVLDDVPPPSRRSGTIRAYGKPPPEDGDVPNADARIELRSDPPRSTQPEINSELPFRIAKETAIATFEKAYLGPLIERCNGNVSQAARAAKMDRMYLHQLAQKHGFKVGRKA